MVVDDGSGLGQGSGSACGLRTLRSDHERQPWSDERCDEKEPSFVLTPARGDEVLLSTGAQLSSF
jgi:hypothetical protein